MIDELDERLLKWASSKLSGGEVSLEAPSGDVSGSGVSIYLLDLVPKPSVRGDRRPPLLATARYLVSAWGDKPKDAHGALEALLFDAMQEPEFEVDQKPISLESWSAFGVAPRPSFILSAVIRKELPEPDIKIALEPVFEASPMANLHGIVITPDDIPVARAKVELPILQAFAMSDSRGRFCIAGVPTDPPTRSILVSARGRKKAYEVDAVASEEDPLLLRFDPREA